MMVVAIKLAPYSPITHIFVVMLENHSFDNMFAMSGIKGITAATISDSNSYNGKTYAVQPSAPLSMPLDPGHDFLDVVEQLGGQGANYPSGGPYPTINNSGFAANYAKLTNQGAKLPSLQDIGDVMACFATPSQLPVLYQLATEFALCDHWYSSMPGSTWPNRFFVHGSSSSGLDDSPPAEAAAIKARFDAIHTRGHARAYMDEVMEKIKITKEQRQLAVRHKSQ